MPKRTMSRRSERRSLTTSRWATASRISAPKVARRKTAPSEPTRPNRVVARAAPHWTEEIEPSTIDTATAGLPRIPGGLPGRLSPCAPGRATLSVSGAVDIPATLAIGDTGGGPRQHDAARRARMSPVPRRIAATLLLGLLLAAYFAVAAAGAEDGAAAMCDGHRATIVGTSGDDVIE